MKKEETYNQSSHRWEDFEQLPDITRVKWKDDKDAIWDRMESQLETPKETKIVLLARPAFRYAVAAVFVLLMAITGVLRFYSKTVTTVSGEHFSVVLPDGSTVELNAGSSLKYYPLWWSFERRLALTGEAFFQVEKGNKFVVKSVNGQTKVMGTSFNIYSRESDYRVNCITGKVQVKASNGKAVLLPNDQAELNEAGSFYVRHKVKTEGTISWIDNKFLFTSVLVPEVAREIERQYNVKIQVPQSLVDKKYTGNFSKEQSVEEVLHLLTRSYGVKFVQKQEGEFQIIQNQ